MEQLHFAERGPTKPLVVEKIRSAAIRFQGEIFLGLNHGLAIKQLEEKYPRWQIMTDQSPEEGFYTNTGRFVDRREADEVATAARQVDEERRQHRVNQGDLDSYDLVA